MDDETDVADSFAYLLKLLGQDVVVAYSGESALSKVSDHRPQLVFLDLSMPDMSGAVLAQRLRAQYPDDPITLVALSGHSRDSSIAQGGEFDHYLLKPSAIDAVRTLLLTTTVEGERQHR
ncbi:MAG: response regulator [Candidatus Thiodiazotropha sp.]